MSQGLPEDDRNETVIQRYASNRLRVVPQLRFSLDKTDEIDLAFFADGGHPCEVAVEESLHLIGEICHDAVLSSICPWNAGILSDYDKKPHNACSPNVNNITYALHLKPNLGEITPVSHFAEASDHDHPLSNQSWKRKD